MLVAAICFFFSPARRLTRFSGTELLPHRSNEPITATRRYAPFVLQHGLEVA
jgi:hypothetical protein